MSRVAFLALSLVFLAGPAVAQLPSLNNPNPPCWMCVESPSAGSFSERHYQRQQRSQSYNQSTWQDYVQPRSSAPPTYQGQHSLSDRAPIMPSYGADHWWPTPELQMQHDRNALEEWKATTPCPWPRNDC